jgi:SAM-dependent methyltransferase
MAVKQRVVGAVISQFSHPRGVGGRLVGWTMGRRSSNVQRSEWAVSLLDLQVGDRMLEVGCGPGVALAAALRSGAHVVGVDRSEVMIGQARRRNRDAVDDGRLELIVASVDDLATFTTPFDAAIAVNTIGHWDDPLNGLERIRDALRPGATFAAVSQPRCPGATAEHSKAAGDELARLLTTAGYREPRMETLDLDPPAVCILASCPL